MKNQYKLSILLVVLLMLTGCLQKTDDDLFFQKAVPVWPEGRQFEMNMTVEFRAEFGKPSTNKAVLNITGSSIYRIYLNNEFVGHGPARAGHGYYRVDEWDLSKHLIDGQNILKVEVAGYNVNSFYLLDQPSFVQAEIVSGDKVLAATSPDIDDFGAYQISERVQKVPRYSFQRPFIEYYKIRLEAYGLRLEDKDKDEDKGLRLEVENVGPKKLIARRIPYPDFNIVRPKAIVAKGTVETGIKRDNYWRDRAVVNIGPKLKGFTEDELELNPAIELQEMENTSCKLQVADCGLNNKQISDVGSKKSAAGSMQFSVGSLKEGEFIIVDLGTNLTGFIGTEIQVNQSTRLFITFDEILQEGDVNFKRLGTISAITYDLEPGTHNLQPATCNLESLEPYTFRYAKIIVVKGEISVNDFYLREYANPDIQRASFISSDKRLNRIFDAGVETFRQNAVDVFMDCPHRERAGWLCDSYFTARVAQDVSGNSLIEKNFFENFLLPDSFAHLPEGMLPMCYPADHNDSVFIPNWAMWFVVELEEYLNRSQDRQLVDDLEPKVMALLEYFEPFKNEDGLLENLDSWIFVEWSAANRFVRDVNYPTNMLFAKTLEVAGKLYNKNELIIEADLMRDKIRKQSFNGQFFADNAIRRQEGRKARKQEVGQEGRKAESLKGDLNATNNTSEVCQYFAFYFDVASPETYPELWAKLSTEFGPKRMEKGLYPNVHPANSFVGNYLRLELLSRYGLKNQILEESFDFFDYMALETGTLWENISPAASCNHGFASHIVHVLYRDVLGIAEVDQFNKVVRFQVPDVGLENCMGQMPIGDELIKFEWKKSKGEIEYEYEVPDGWEVEVLK